VTKEAVIRKLGAFPPPATKILVDDQDVTDIIQAIQGKHKECVSHYDAIYSMFDADGSWYDVANRLFEFCKENLAYRVESVKWQYVSVPMTMMRKGHCDCKGYALLIAGVIDAMKRAGEEVDWCYRFASYNLLDTTPGHVFVVINPKTDNIWVDPVLPRLNTRSPRPWHTQDVRVNTCRSMGRKMAGIGFIPGTKLNINAKTCPCAGGSARIGISSTEQSLLDSVKEYSDGVANAIQTAQGSGTLNTICLMVLATASVAIPVIAAALAIVKVAAVVVSDDFGAGSLAARLLDDVANNPLTAPVTIIESIFSGRTYESDQYRAAQFYQFYVLGNASANALNKISDADVVPALKWFVDRTGVFISGAEHILGLAQSPGAYTQYVGVNAYTTTDMNRVNAASNVAQANFIQNNVAGSWANTPGVYDAWIANLAQQENETVEEAAAQANYTDVYSTAATTGANPVSENPTGISLSSYPIIPIALALAAAVLLIPSSKTGKNAQ
jgi:hypothetical protein